MAIFNLGSLNVDYFYRLQRLPAPGETLSTIDRAQGLGGKGANMSMAAARAGARVSHIGAVGADGAWIVQRLAEDGVDTTYITQVAVPTGHAIVMVAADGENAILVMAGANHALCETQIEQALLTAQRGDTLLMQNETTLQRQAAGLARDCGMRVAYAAAPFEAEAVQVLLPFLDILILNAVEAAQLQEATGQKISQLPIRQVIVTQGHKGALLFDNGQKTRQSFSALSVQAVDTTGAGDTVAGYILAACDRGETIEHAMAWAMCAGALMVMRRGTADVIPRLAEVAAVESAQGPLRPAS
ncbi:MAG: ribokinase [Rhodobacteraceae bacterium]|nr:ribokinase [Paracoccaceae bacterium]